MALDAVRKLAFGRFRLEIRAHPHDRKQTRLWLFDGPDLVHVERKALQFLQFLADDHPGEEVTKDELALHLWEDQTKSDNVEKQLSNLRGALDDQTKPYKIIETLPNSRGYKFLPKVKAEGDLGRLDGLLTWSNKRFFDFLDHVRFDKEYKEDLRIVTTHFSCGIPDLRTPFREIMRQGGRIRIVMMNPDNHALMHARHSLRQDLSRKKPPTEEALDQLTTQIKLLEEIRTPDCTGTLEVKLSDTMPAGFLVHSHHGALLGIFLAQSTYSDGPMIDNVTPASDLWVDLFTDWARRWYGPDFDGKLY